MRVNLRAVRLHQAEREFCRLFAAPAQQKLGLGRFLLNSAIAACADQREQWLGLRVDSDNESALRLYVSLGFGERTTF
jgi:ribosomal protein S18 acetylase RimI-like enzyme